MKFSPSITERYRFEFGDKTFTATPVAEKLVEFIYEAQKELMAKISAHEEYMILEGVSNEALLRLRNSIDKILFKRQNPDSELKSL